MYIIYPVENKKKKRKEMFNNMLKEKLFFE